MQGQRTFQIPQNVQPSLSYQQAKKYKVKEHHLVGIGWELALMKER